ENIMRYLLLLTSFIIGMFGVATPAPAQIIASFWQQPLVSGQKVRVKKMARDMAEVRQRIKTTGPSEFQDPQIIAKFQKRFTQFNNALARYPQLKDPDVIEARKQYNLLAQALTSEFNRAKAQKAKLGDVQTTLATLEANSRTYAVPKPMNIPFDEAAAIAWVKATSSARTVTEHNQKQLAFILPLAYLPNSRGTVQSGAAYDQGDLRRLQSWNSQMFRDLQDGYPAMTKRLDEQLQFVERELKQRLNSKPGDTTNFGFIGAGAQAKSDKDLARKLPVIQSELFLQKAMKQSTKKNKTRLALYEKVKADFAKKRKDALKSSYLPKPKSKNKKQLKIAKEILKNPKYEFGNFAKIVLTSKKIITRERKNSEVKLDDVEFKLSGDVKLSGTETTWTYKWEEFTFAVPLQETDDDTWYIWSITAKKFSSGGSKTPIGRWVSGAAYQGDQILAKNVKK
ncbi:hypothetical protein MNBD_ALPHA06-1134, partial [hydrothermal vent metagenome]